MSNFRTSKFDAKLIASQIICLQSLYYLVLSILVLIYEALTGVPVMISRMLSFSQIDNTVFGWGLFTVFIINSFITYLFLISAWFILKIVQRVRLCLDFACTLHLIHLITVWLYSGFPTSFLWWLMLTVSTATCFKTSEYLCIQEESKPIILANARNDNFEMSSFLESGTDK